MNYLIKANYNDENQMVGYLICLEYKPLLKIMIRDYDYDADRCWTHALQILDTLNK